MFHCRQETTYKNVPETNGVDNEDSINLTIGEDEEKLLAEEVRTLPFYYHKRNESLALVGHIFKGFFFIVNQGQIVLLIFFARDKLSLLRIMIKVC